MTLEGTKRFMDKSGEYYLKNIQLQNKRKDNKRKSLNKPLNLENCLNRKENKEEPLKENVINQQDDDLDVMSDKQPETQNDNIKKDSVNEEKEQEKPEIRNENPDSNSGKFGIAEEENQEKPEKVDNDNIPKDIDNNQPQEVNKLNESEIISEKNENPAPNTEEPKVEDVPKEEKKEEPKEEQKEEPKDDEENKYAKIYK